MRTKLKNYINIAAGLLIIFYFPSIISILRRIHNRIYNKHIAHKFLRCGDNLCIDNSATIVGFRRIEIANNFQVFSRLRLEAIESFNGQHYEPSIVIGNNVSINYDCHIGAINQIVIGNNVLIGSKVLITDHSHGDGDFKSLSTPPVKRALVSKGPVFIGDNVWIGDGVAILPGVKIGRNAIIGANSVIVRDVPDNTIAAGNPARVVREIR
jgi:acetyltransferase-like isoleucine patch superfamily enzyme